MKWNKLYLQAIRMHEGAKAYYLALVEDASRKFLQHPRGNGVLHSNTVKLKEKTMKAEGKLVDSIVDKVVGETVDELFDGKVASAAEYTKDTEARLLKLTGFTASILHKYNAPPDEWDRFRAIIGET